MGWRMERIKRGGDDGVISSVMERGSEMAWSKNFEYLRKVDRDRGKEGKRTKDQAYGLVEDVVDRVGRRRVKRRKRGRIEKEVEGECKLEYSS
jgi:hypothetical protein